MGNRTETRNFKDDRDMLASSKSLNIAVSLQSIEDLFILYKRVAFNQSADISFIAIH